jgi:hypothetical protein
VLGQPAQRLSCNTTYLYGPAGAYLDEANQEFEPGPTAWGHMTKYSQIFSLAD